MSLRACLGMSLVAATLAVSDPRDFDADRSLPGFHFVPWPYDWMNDPNGPMWDPVHEKYHLFYQYQTPRMWGHAVSDDLVSWQQLPMAITRQKDYDEGGDFSGSGTIMDDENKTPVLTVSSNTNSVVFLMVPEDRTDPYLTNWKYVDDNPVYYTDCRDPTEIIKTSEGKYRIFDGMSNGTAAWEADSFDAIFSNTGWTHIGTLHENTYGHSYFECPDVYPLLKGNKVEADDAAAGTWVSKFSDGGDWWLTGTYDEANAKFIAYDEYATPTLYDSNTAFYASKTFLDTKGDNDRRVLWGWLIGPGNDEFGWTGSQSLPRVVEAASDGKGLLNYPLPELATLRDAENAVDASGLTLVNTSSEVLDITGKMLDIEATITFTGDASDAMYPDTDMMGSDFNVVAVSYTDPAICQAACDADDQCVAWTLVPGEKCCLKDAVPVATPSTGIYSGTKGIAGHSALSCGFRVLLDTKEGAEFAEVVVDGATDSVKTMTVGTKTSGVPHAEATKPHSRAELGGMTYHKHTPTIKTTRATLAADGMSTTLRVLVDASIIESFADGGMINTWQQHNPSLDTSVGVAAVSKGTGGTCSFSDLKIYPMSPFTYDVSLCEDEGCL